MDSFSSFAYQKLLLFLSRPQAWYIITVRSKVHIISSFGAASHHALACILLRLDDIPQQVADDMHFGMDDIKGFALIAPQNYDIINARE